MRSDVRFCDPGYRSREGVLTDDATVQLQLPTNNFGSLPQLEAGPMAQVFLRFSAGQPAFGYPAAHPLCDSAPLRQQSRIPRSGGLPLCGNPLVREDHQLRQFTVDDPPTAQFTVDTADTFVTFDATKAVQGALNNGLTSFGYALTSVGSTDVFFDSKESTSTSQPATLAIELTGPQGPQGLPGLERRYRGTGPTGPKGDPGEFSQVPTACPFQVKDYTSSSLTGFGTYYLSCPAGYPQLVSGGCGFPFHEGTAADVSGTADMKYFYSGPSTRNSNGEWQCAVYNGALADRIVRLYVNCAR